MKIFARRITKNMIIELEGRCFRVLNCRGMFDSEEKQEYECLRLQDYMTDEIEDIKLKGSDVVEEVREIEKIALAYMYSEDENVVLLDEQFFDMYHFPQAYLNRKMEEIESEIDDFSFVGVIYKDELIKVIVNRKSTLD